MAARKTACLKMAHKAHHLQSLPESFGQTIANFHMNKIECTLAELLNMLVTAQKSIQGSKGKEVALIASSSKTKEGNKKRKGKTSVVKPKGGIAKNKGKATVREDKDRKSTRLNSSHSGESRMPSSA